MVAGHLQEKKGLFYIVLNFVDSDGKRKRKWIATGLPVKGNKRKAEAMLVAERQKYQPAEYQRTADANMLFADYMLYWLRQIKSSVDITTYAGYKTNVEKRIVPFFRGRKVTLGGLRAGDIQDFYTYCATELEISNNTIIKYHANISKALNDAVRLEKIPMTPLKRGMRPKQVEHIGKFYTLSEVEHLLSCVKGDGAEFPVLMAAFYGLRRSEIMGLKWEAIDFDANTITIAHVVVEVSIDGKYTIVAKDRPKNKKSYRTLPLVPEYRRLLLQMKKHQEEYRELCGNCYHESDYIYVNDIGEQIKPNYVTQHFKLVLRKNNLREITFKPYYDKYIMSFVIEDMAAPFYPDMPYMAGLDLGTDNIAAIACTDGTSVVYKGGAVLSENQFFAKQRAQAVSIITRGHEHKHADSAYLEALSREHDCFLKDQMHKISTDIIRYCVDHRVGILVIGVNKLWKQNTNMGKKNNQKFVSIPHYRLRQMIEYKALRAGIDVVEQEESYTSKADVTASDFMPVYGKVKARPVFSGRRIERGMYLCRDGYCINADCNGAANILRKAVPDAWKGFKDFHFLATPASRGFHQLNPAGRNNSHKQHPDWKILSPAV